MKYLVEDGNVCKNLERKYLSQENKCGISNKPCFAVDEEGFDYQMALNCDCYTAISKNNNFCYSGEQNNYIFGKKQF